MKSRIDRERCLSRTVPDWRCSENTTARVADCLEDVSRYADVVECEKGSSPAHLDGCEVFNRGDGGSSDPAVVRKAEGE